MGAGPSKKAPDEEEGGDSHRRSVELPEDPVMQKMEEMMDLIDEEDEGPSDKFKQLLAGIPVTEISRIVKWGFTPLQNAISEARPAHTRLLLEHGADFANSVRVLKKAAIDRVFDLNSKSSKLLDVCTALEEKTPIPPLMKLLILMQNEEEGDISQDFLDLLRTVTKDGTKEVSTEKIGPHTLLQHAANKGQESHIQALLDHGVAPSEAKVAILNILLKKDTDGIVSKKFMELLNQLSVSEVSTIKVGGFNILQQAAKNGKASHVRALFDFGVSPNADTADTGRNMPPLLLAAQTGQLSVLKEFGKEERTIWSADLGGDILTWLLRSDTGSKNERKECLKWLQNKDPDIGENINTVKCSGHTALLLAGKFDWGDNQQDVEDKDQIIFWLLGKGANITDLPAIDVEGFLDRCIKSEGNPGEEDFHVKVNFKWYQKIDKQEKHFWIKDICESKTEEHFHLLKHPVIAIYLWRKWQTLTNEFRQSLRSSTMLTVTATRALLTAYGGQPSKSDSDQNLASNTTVSNYCHFPTNWLWSPSNGVNRGWSWGWEDPSAGLAVTVVMVMWLFLLVIRDLLRKCSPTTKSMQTTSMDDVFFLFFGLLLIVLGSHGLTLITVTMVVWELAEELKQMKAQKVQEYIKNKENILDLTILASTPIMLVLPNLEAADCDWLRHIAAFLLLLVWFKLVLVMANHPWFSGNAIILPMLTKVLKTSLPVFLFFSLFLGGFSFAFYILMQQTVPPGMETEEDDFPFFDAPHTSFSKTLAMFVGELDFSDLPYHSSKLSPVTFLFLVVFVFAVMIVQMNLLSGLAVSDVRALQKNAEIESIRSRVKTITALEKRKADKMVQRFSCIGNRNKAKPLCEEGHTMQLAKGSQDESWECDYCNKSNDQREDGERVAAWRCTADLRNSKGKTRRNGCDYDICSDCIPEYRMKLLNFIKVKFNVTKAKGIFAFMKRIWTGAENELPDTLRNEIRKKVLNKKCELQMKDEESEIREVKKKVEHMTEDHIEMKNQLNKILEAIQK